jgi:hypothetical protein
MFPREHRSAAKVVMSELMGKVGSKMTLATLAEALFVSPLQPSEHPTPAEVRAAIDDSLNCYGGPLGCASWLAKEYGEHPEVAADRMRWALDLIRN